MNLKKRIELLVNMGEFLMRDSDAYRTQREEAFRANKWFIPDMSLLSGKRIADRMLRREILIKFSKKYHVNEDSNIAKTVGVVMAGNIPFVGLHDMLCVFLSGHRQMIKLSSKDTVLMKMIVEQIAEVEPEIRNWINFSDMLKGCDAYIATGTDNSARYFEYYFSRYPNLIRKNRTSVAILTGEETKDELMGLADDIALYFGLGCRNVTKIFVPKGYDFVPLLDLLKKYDYFKDHDRYRNNYDYQLTIAILNKKFYMTNGSILMIEDENPLSPISQLNYSFYQNKDVALASLDPEKIQSIVGRGYIPFGASQDPGIMDFPDGVDTMSFLTSL